MKKIKKLLTVGLSFLFMLCMSISLVGCGKEVNSITDFTRFSDMTRETDKIEVTFDDYSGYPFYFTIDNQEDIDDIMDIIFSSSFTKMKKRSKRQRPHFNEDNSRRKRISITRFYE